jgi:hypothetical protein
VRPLLYPTYLGRSWIVRNESCRPDDEVLALLGFVLDRTGGLSAKGAIHVKDAGRRSRGNYSGVAGSRKLGHSIPGWVGGRTRFYMRLTLPLDDWRYYGLPEVCGHSTELRRLMGEIGATSLTELLEEKLSRGETKLGRWPIYRLWDWQEVLVSLAAHEAAHLVQYDRERGHSEVWCEEFAVSVLNEFRAARPCGDEPAPAADAPSGSHLPGEVSPSTNPLGSLGLVAGPAPADPPTNRRETPVSSATLTEPKGPSAATAENAKAPAAANTSAALEPLFDALLAEVKTVASLKTTTVKKQSYVRLDTKVDGKRVTLAYMHYPTKKSVRVLVPNKKAKGGFETTAIVKPGDVAKAVATIEKRLAAAAA